MAINFFTNLFGANVPPQPPPPLPKMPEQPKDTFQPSSEREFAAVKNYNTYGTINYDLNDRNEVKDLLAHSPQLDNNPQAVNDRMRCVGASLVALSLLDGRPQANAEALRKTAQQYGVTPSEAQNEALNSMAQGHLTPSETAHLQVLAWQTAGNTDKVPNPEGRGANAGETGSALASLRANNGLTNLQTASVNAQTQSEGKHATATAVDQDGQVVSYNPWPQKNGTATVVEENLVPTDNVFLSGRQTINNKGKNGPELISETAITTEGKVRGGSTASDNNAAIYTTRQTIGPEGIAPEQVGEGRPVYIDPNTKKPLNPQQVKALEKQMLEAQAKAEAEGEAGGMGAPQGATAEAGATPAGVTAQTGHPANGVAAPAESRTTVNVHKNVGVQVAPTQVDVTGQLASKEVGVNAAAINKQVGYQSKNVQAQAGVQVMSASAYAGASANVDLKNLKINAEVHAGVEANLVDAQASAHVKLGNIGDVGGDARARVGADALGQAGLGFDPKNGTINVGASGEAFTGARANAGVALNLGPVGAHAGVAVQAGVGIEAGIDVGMKNGKFKFNLDFGFSLGIGIRFNLGFSIDFKKIGKGIVDGVKAIGKGFKKLGKAMAKGAKKMKKAAKKAVKWAGKLAKKGMKKLKKVGKKVGKKLKKLFGRRKHKHHHKAAPKHEAAKAGAKHEHRKAAKAVAKHEQHKAVAKHEHYHMQALKKELHAKASQLDQVA